MTTDQTAPAIARPRPVVFIVDDDRSVRRALVRAIRWAGHEAEAFASGDEFLASGRLNVPDCLVLDLCMPGLNGLEVQERLADLGSTIPVIFISAHEEDLANAKATQEGSAIAFLHKPFDDEQLMREVHAAIGIAGDK